MDQPDRIFFNNCHDCPFWDFKYHDCWKDEKCRFFVPGNTYIIKWTVADNDGNEYDLI